MELCNKTGLCALVGLLFVYKVNKLKFVAMCDYLIAYLDTLRFAYVYSNSRVTADDGHIFGRTVFEEKILGLRGTR